MKLSVRPQFRMEMPGFDVLKVPKAAQAQDPPPPARAKTEPPHATPQVSPAALPESSLKTRLGR